MELTETLASGCFPFSLFLCVCVLNIFLFLANNLPFVVHFYCPKVFLTPRHQLVLFYYLLRYFSSSVGRAG